MKLSTNSRLCKRFRNHLWLAFISLTLTALCYGVLSYFYSDPQRWTFRWSMATGYVGAALLAATLSLGTLRILRGHSISVSTDLRRDTGIWCAILSIAHIIFGLNIHMKNWTLYFVTEKNALRTDLFGLANYSGLAAAFIIVALLATSNDFFLSLLKSKIWKIVQRWNYVFAVLVALHAFIYIAIEKRLIPFSFIFGAFVIWTVVIQAVGFQKRRLSELNLAKTDMSK